MFSFLTDPKICNWEVLGTDWSVKGLLKQVATSTKPKFHCLIDTGALVTEMSNLQVAQFLLDNGLAGLEGVVFLDEEDR